MMQVRFRVRIAITILLAWTIGLQSNAQTVAGVKFGLSAPYISPEDIAVNYDGVNYYDIKVDRAAYGVHAGLFLEATMGHFFIQPELLFNSSTVNYLVDTLYTFSEASARVTETYRQLDMPLMMGFKAGVLRIGVGPVGHLHVSSESDFDGYEGYQPDFEKFTYGWQAGIGFDFWKLHFDVRYESNQAQFGDHLTFFGKDYDFATDNSRFIGSVGLSF